MAIDLRFNLIFSWAIDPFGHSSAMAWAHREMGLDGMVINRVHQDIKQSWNKNQQVNIY